MTKQKESNEIQVLREKHVAAIAHHKKLDDTLAKVTAKVENLEQNMAKLLFQVKDAEKAHRLAEKEFLREEISKTDLDGIAKKQEADVNRMHESERALNVAKQVISDINHEIRTAVNRRDVARQRLANALRSKNDCPVTRWA